MSFKLVLALGDFYSIHLVVRDLQQESQRLWLNILHLVGDGCDQG